MKNLRTGIEIKELKPIKKGTKIAEYIKPLLKDPKVVAKQLGIDYDDFLEKQELATEKMEALKKFLIQKIQSDCGAAIIKKGTIISDPDTILNDPKLTRQLIKYFNLSPPKLNKNSDNYSEFVLNPESQNPISVNDLAIIMEHFTNDADLTLERNIILILLEFKKTFLKIFLSRETLLNNRERVFKAWEIIYSLTVKSPVICNDMLFSPKIIKKNNDELDSLGEILEQQNKKKIRDLINEEFPQDKKEFVKNHYMLAIRLISLYPQLLNEHEKKFCFMSFNYLLFRESQSAIFFTNLLGGSAFWKFFKDWCGKNITILDEHSSTLPAIFSFLSTWEKSNKRTSIPAYIEKIFENPQAYFRIKKQKKTTSRKTRKTIQPPKKLTPTATPQTPNKTSKPEKEPFITPNIKLLDSERLTFNIKNLPEAQNKNENVSLWGRVCKAPNRFEIKPDKNGKFSYPGSLKRNKENTLCFRFAPNENSPNTEYPEIKINISKIIKKKPDTTAPWEPPEKTPPVAIHTKIGKTSADVAFITSPPKKASLDERQEHEELLQMALEHFGPLLENADLEEDRISVNISIDDLLDVITKEDITYIEEHLAYISFKENRLSIDLKHDTESEDLETFINNIYKKLLIKKKTIDEEQSEINKWRSQLKRNECSAELIQNQRKFNRASRQPDTSKKGWYRERNNKTGYWWELIWESNKEGYFNRLKILKDELQKKAGIILSIDKQSKTFPQPFKIQIPNNDNKRIVVWAKFGESGEIIVKTKDDTFPKHWNNFALDIGRKILTNIGVLSDFIVFTGKENIVSQNTETVKLSRNRRESLISELKDGTANFALYTDLGEFCGTKKGKYSAKELLEMDENCDPELLNIEVVTRRDKIDFCQEGKENQVISFNSESYRKVFEALHEPRIQKYLLLRIFSTAYHLTNGTNSCPNGKSPIHNPEIQAIIRSHFLIKTGFLDSKANWEDGALTEAWRKLWDSSKETNAPSKFIEKFRKDFIFDFFRELEKKGFGINFAKHCTLPAKDFIRDLRD